MQRLRQVLWKINRNKTIFTTQQTFTENPLCTRPVCLRTWDRSQNKTDVIPALSPSIIQCTVEETNAASKEEKGNMKTDLYQTTVTHLELCGSRPTEQFEFQILALAQSN